MPNVIKVERIVKCSAKTDGFKLSFSAMASPCELLIDTTDKALALRLGNIAANEAWRIEDKYSRYDKNSQCSQINSKAGHVTKIDQETFRLLSFANDCYVMSGGAFDITSGILRQAWHFDGSDNIPSEEKVNSLLNYVGWHKVEFSKDSVLLKEGMEIDFGGLGKEYAVDNTVLLLSKVTDTPFLVNYGGDIAVHGKKAQDEPWLVGIEHLDINKLKKTNVTIKQGAVATSGDANRFLLKNETRYSHILDVNTGWPVESPPRAITVAAPHCIQAGFLATLALMQGENAEAFLTEQEILHWSIR